MNNKGFSLVEMAIVLVILGLLIAATVASTAMIGQAGVRAIIAEVSKIRIAKASFQGAYNLQLPGDLANAYDYWPGQCGDDSSSPAGCNGNGNKKIGFANYENGYVEVYRFWQHLSLSKMLDYNVTGIKNTSEPFSDEKNHFASKGVQGAIYWPQFPYDWQTGQFYSNDIKKSNVFIFGRPHATLEAPVDRALSPGDAHNMDLKTDDSRPRTGKVKAYNYNHATNGWAGTTAGFVADTECTSAGNVSKTDEELLDVVYTISLESEECILFIDF